MITSTKPLLSRYDKAFKEDYTRNYHLTIRVSPDGFSFVVFSLDKNRYLGLETFQIKRIDQQAKLAAALDELCILRQWITYPFHSVVVIVDNTFNTLIPVSLYEEKEKGVYLAFNQEFQDNSRIQSDLLKAAEAYNLYYLPNPLVEKVKDIWANARIVHLQSVLVESLLITHRNQQSDQTAFIHLRHDNFDLIVLKNDKLLFINNFRFNTPEDFIYFVLFSFDQLRLNPETVQVVLSGIIEKGSKTYDILFQYVRNIRFAERNPTFEYSYILEDIPVHQHFIIYNALQCEL
ncbi:MAG TPA: DUF3822 family protein [Bacteroidales bacterium]|nr:DUF3822 family protein [Bacteroidales bacterium]HQQ13758.1 DUF3822 family protein [Bacteroidales bacterium]